MRTSPTIPLVILRRAAALALPLILFAATAASAQMQGFTASGAESQRALEARFDAQLEPDSLREWMRVLTARPFYVGAPYNREMATWLRDRFRGWGLDADIVEYQVLFPKPRVRELTLIAPTQYRAALEEPAVPGDTQTSRCSPTGCRRTTRIRRTATSRRSSCT
jgi:N-acetylated-alpha-linked acidic dipeptidase